MPELAEKANRSSIQIQLMQKRRKDGSWVLVKDLQKIEMNDSAHFPRYSLNAGTFFRITVSTQRDALKRYVNRTIGRRKINELNRAPNKEWVTLKRWRIVWPSLLVRRFFRRSRCHSVIFKWTNISQVIQIVVLCLQNCLREKRWLFVRTRRQLRRYFAHHSR